MSDTVTPPTPAQRWDFERRQLLAQIDHLQNELNFWKPRIDARIEIGARGEQTAEVFRLPDLMKGWPPKKLEVLCARCGKPRDVPNATPVGSIDAGGLCEPCNIAMRFCAGGRQS